ncbi:homoserine kinase [Lentiprolixibacter aurantiacus]|uniref:Homoserine kinase n=1 Tax=Lentiprolixibacter aurantiacus TaxID=2993939 RepID=A0AAE3MM44_9FLAO|nr:homoserine kinase [Lentiprolixibacter aurantiacus]MCX2719938.1 homoserine kinase [Lentiprolixibacter aurantiacus]
MEGVRIFCPATIANISCGFDVLGVALDSVGDEMTLRKTDTPGIRITKIIGQEIPLETEQNVAGVAALALLGECDFSGGIEIEIEKKIKPGSGIGSSAASAAGAAFGLNLLLGNPFNRHQLVRFAMQGEKLASGVAHADNVAPALLGGFTLVRSYDPLDVIKLNTPEQLYATIIHPQIEVKTADSRKILKTGISLKDGIRQWGNVGGLIAGLYTEDYDLISRSLEDHIVEPIRSMLIPGYDDLKGAAVKAGALGVGISGSGPSVFALSKGSAKAREVADAFRSAYSVVGVPFEIHVSKINQEGIKVLEQW